MHPEDSRIGACVSLSSQHCAKSNQSSEFGEYSMAMESNRRVRRKAGLGSRKRLFALAYGLIVVLVLAAAGYFLRAAFIRPELPPLAGNVIDVEATMAGFDIREIRVKAGEPVTIRLTSMDNQFHMDGGGQHQWAVDELDVNIIAPPLSSSHATFTPMEPGTYLFYCDVCCGGRASPAMQGTLIVEA
jgi:cytochrome c oxidase subunit II